MTVDLGLALGPRSDMTFHESASIPRMPTVNMVAAYLSDVTKLSLPSLKCFSWTPTESNELDEERTTLNEE